MKARKPLQLAGLLLLLLGRPLNQLLLRVAAEGVAASASPKLIQARKQQQHQQPPLPLSSSSPSRTAGAGSESLASSWPGPTRRRQCLPSLQVEPARPLGPSLRAQRRCLSPPGACFIRMLPASAASSRPAWLMPQSLCRRSRALKLLLLLHQQPLQRRRRRRRTNPQRGY